MKTPVHRRSGANLAPSRPGFTLIELLVVIAIIAVLAAIGFQVGNFAINKAKQMKALAAIRAVEDAVGSFNNDTGTLPVDGITSDAEINSNSAEGLQMLRVLLNKETTDPVLNVRGTKYLHVKEGKSGFDGITYDAAGDQVTGLYDPWGGDYKFVLDGDFDETIEVKPKAAAQARVLQRRVAGWSDGADGVEDGNAGSIKDDVTTW